MWNTQNGVVGDYEYFWISHEKSEDLLKELATNLNAVKVCTTKTLSECGGRYDVKTAKRTNDGTGNTATQNIMNYNGRAVLADGSFIAILTQVQNNGSCKYTYWANDKDENGNYIPTTDPSSPTGYQGKYGTGLTCGYIGIDTNGLKGPNQVGKDNFLIGMTAKGFWSNTDSTGNLEYILQHNKLIKTDKYEIGKY